MSPLRRCLVLVALGVPALAFAQDAADWPTYMRDIDRSGVSPAVLKPPLSLAWMRRTRQGPQPAWPPPAKLDLFHGMRKHSPRVIYDRAFHVVGAGERVFFGSSADDAVRCLDANTGELKWTFFTEGPVRLAPTLADGTLLFGSDDGFAYCLNAADGALIWKQRVAQCVRRIPGNSRIVSAWPIRTGLFVHDGKAHCTAGLFVNEGVRYVVLDAASGRILSSKNQAVSMQGYPRRVSRLLVPTGRRPQGQVLDGLPPAGVAAFEADKAASAAFPYARVSAAATRFYGGDDAVAAFVAGERRPVWMAKVDGRAYGLAIVGRRLFVSTDRGTLYCFVPGEGAGRNAAVPAPRDWAWPDAGTKKLYTDTCDEILTLTKKRKGYCLVLGAGDGHLAAALAEKTSFRILCREPNPKRVAALRARLATAGLYGSRVVVHHGTLDQLPYADHLFNVVAHDGLARNAELAGSVDEAFRVTTPCGGVTVLGLDPDAPNVIRRGPLDGSGWWTHFYADPANTTNSRDRRISAPLRMQWFGRPGPRPMIDRHNRSAAPLALDGRLFVTGWDYIAAVDAYNGTVLWEMHLPGSARPIALKNCGNMAVTDGALYVAAKGACFALDPETGTTLRAFQVPAKGQDWGYVAVSGHLLFGSSTKPGASSHKMSQHSWRAGYAPKTPLVCSDEVFAFDRLTGKLLWRYRPAQGVIANPLIGAAGYRPGRRRRPPMPGRLYVVESENPATRTVQDGRNDLTALTGKGATLLAINAGDGDVVWRTPLKIAFQHAAFLSIAGGRIVLTGSKTAGKKIWYDLHAFDLGTGEPVWNASHHPPLGDLSGGHGELTQHPVVVGDEIQCYDARYKLDDGRKTLWKWNRGGHGCGTLSASETALFVRGGNPMMIDAITTKGTRLTRETRPGCWINILPVGGLVLIPEGSSGCACPYPVQTSMALVPLKAEK
jgi:outer membrane protein assembly factor BamB